MRPKKKRRAKRPQKIDKSALTSYVVLAGSHHGKVLTQLDTTENKSGVLVSIREHVAGFLTEGEAHCAIDRTRLADRSGLFETPVEFSVVPVITASRAVKKTATPLEVCISILKRKHEPTAAEARALELLKKLHEKDTPRTPERRQGKKAEASLFNEKDATRAAE